MNTIAERYVKLVLAVGQHDADYVDAYYGPAEWKADAERQKTPLAEIDADAERLIADMPDAHRRRTRDELVVAAARLSEAAARGASRARADARRARS